MLKLAHGLSFAELHERDGLARLDAAFLDHLGAAESALRPQLEAARATASLDSKAESALILEIAPHLDDFLAELFGIQAEFRTLAARHHELAPLYAVKRQFVQRRAGNRVKPEEAARLDGPAIEAELKKNHLDGRFDELTFAKKVTHWLGDEAGHAVALDLALKYAAWALHTAEGRARVQAGVLFKAPAKIDPHNLLVHAQKIDREGVVTYTIKPEQIRRRKGFALTDPGTDLVGALDQANYCIWCHTQGKDSCSKGLREKSPEGTPDKVVFKKSAFGVTLAGCPLEEKISEFHTLKAQGNALSALAVIVIDNPMVAATGHRICNDCMKACIYQKQEPVNIPQIETRTLKDVLELPWGFEIYSLLTRWNPLNFRRPLPLPETGYKVLIAGMGPAGFTLAHYLMNEGHAVAGIDGLKIEPLPARFSGIDADGSRVPVEPIRDVQTLYEGLDDRVMAGFGGVAEYGITVRWDKNFLKLVRLLLERRAQFAMYGGVRFGGTVAVEDALELDFDHVALCMGAGKPTVLDIPNGLARGVRAASDFLMALQLTGAAKRDSIANMQVRLPVVVIGGGLTAIDTATEALAYYPVQVEKFLARYEALVGDQGEAALQATWTPGEREIALEFIDHARAIRAERAAAMREQRAPRVLELLQSWGGSTIVYRRRLIDSPSYTLNHEEVEKALEEGISFAEGLSPTRIEVDEHGHARAVRFAAEGKEIELPARSVLIAAGTQPNTVLAREEGVSLALDGKYFQACDEAGEPLKPERHAAKPLRPDVLLHRRNDGRFMSFFGDLHPSYFGNVVKAMGSAKQGYPVVSRVVSIKEPSSSLDDAAFLARLNRDLRAVVHEVRRLTPRIVEVVLRAPVAARRTAPPMPSP